MNDRMLEFRLHGRGGQGIVVAAAIFAEAVFLGGSYARAFSLFGAERRGAPVTAFIRVSSDRLMPRSRIYQPDYVVICDPTLTGVDLAAGLKDEGTLLINAREPLEERFSWLDQLNPGVKIYALDATDIAWKHDLAIGSFPMVNTVMLGAMARLSGLADRKYLEESIRKRVSSKIEANLAASGEGYELVKEVDRLAVRS